MTPRRLLTAVLAAPAGLMLVASAFSVNVLTGMLPRRVTGNVYVWAAVLLAAMAYTIWRERLAAVAAHETRFDVPVLDLWVHRRELDSVLGELKRSRGGTVALTTGLLGAGGFGKTTLALAVCYRRDIRRLFPGGVFWVTVGKDRTGADLAGLVADLVERIRGSRPTTADPQQAGLHLADVLTGCGRTLLVVDDVWDNAQLDVFRYGAPGCTRLVTTRDPRVLPQGTPTVPVDRMDTAPAAQVLTRGLSGFSPALERELLELTGQWPLLLALVNAAVHDRCRRGVVPDAAGRAVARRLRESGPAALDVGDTADRQRAVRATVEYGLASLDGSARDRYLELGAFVEDAEIPFEVVAGLWARSGGLSEAESEDLCQRLSQLSALGFRGSVVLLHDVLRDYARQELGTDRLRDAHRAIVDSARAALRHEPWWCLPARSRYLLTHLADHLAGAGLHTELADLACDARWLDLKIRVLGPARAESDLAAAATPLAGRISRVLAQCAHLLSPLEPEDASTVTLLSHLSSTLPETPGLESLRQPRIRLCWPLPDLPDSRVLRELPGRSWLWSLAVAPDGNWLAAAEPDGQVTIWGTDGLLKGRLNAGRAYGASRWVAASNLEDRRGLFNLGRSGEVAVRASAAGDWLLTVDECHQARLWGADGRGRATLHGPYGAAHLIAVHPSGRLLATGGRTGGVRLWRGDGKPCGRLKGPTRATTGLAFAADTDRLATVDAAGVVRLWSHSGELQATLNPPADPRSARSLLAGRVLALARLGARDCYRSALGYWGRNTYGRLSGLVQTSIAGCRTIRLLAEAGRHGRLRLPRPVGLVAVLPWILLGYGRDRLAFAEGRRCIDPAHPHESAWAWRLRITAGTGQVAFAPDGTWLAAVTDAATVMLYMADGAVRAVLGGHVSGVRSVVIAPDGSWLSTVDGQGSTRLWSPDGALITALEPQAFNQGDVVISPDSARLWLASGGHRAWVIARDGERVTGPVDVEALRREARYAPAHRPVGGHGSVTPAADLSWYATGTQGVNIQLRRLEGEQARAGHWTADVSCASIAPDGTWMVTYHAGDGRTRIRDADGTQRALLDHPEGQVSDVRIAPDGSWLVSVHTVDPYGYGDGPQFRLWAPDGSPLGSLGIGDPATAGWLCRIAPDGGWLAVGGYRDLHLWDPLRGWRLPIPGPVEAESVVIAPDGRWFAGITERETLQIWSAAGEPRGTVALQREAWMPVHTVIAPDSGGLLVPCENALLLCGPDGGVTRSIPCGRWARPVTAPDGTWFALHEDTGTRLFSSDGTERASVPGMWPQISSGSDYLVTVDDSDVWIHHPDGSFRHRVPTGGPARRAAVSPDGTVIAVLQGTALRALDPVTGRWTAGTRIGINHEDRVRLGWFPDSRSLFALCQLGLYGFRLCTD